MRFTIIFALLFSTLLVPGFSFSNQCSTAVVSWEHLPLIDREILSKMLELHDRLKPELKKALYEEKFSQAEKDQIRKREGFFPAPISPDQEVVHFYYRKLDFFFISLEEFLSAQFANSLLLKIDRDRILRLCLKEIDAWDIKTFLPDFQIDQNDLERLLGHLMLEKYLPTTSEQEAFDLLKLRAAMKAQEELEYVVSREKYSLISNLPKEDAEDDAFASLRLKLDGISYRRGASKFNAEERNEMLKRAEQKSTQVTERIASIQSKIEFLKKLKSNLVSEIPAIQQAIQKLAATDVPLRSLILSTEMNVPNCCHRGCQFCPYSQGPFLNIPKKILDAALKELPPLAESAEVLIYYQVVDRLKEYLPLEVFELPIGPDQFSEQLIQVRKSRLMIP